MRRGIAERMTEARATIAQGSCAKQVDLSRIERHGVSWTAYFVKAFARALEVDRIGVAVEVPNGVVVPVVPDARAASLHDIGVRIADFAERARVSALTAADIGGAHATVTNVRATATLLAFPLVVPGEGAILAPGAIADGRCWLALCYDRALQRVRGGPAAGGSRAAPPRVSPSAQPSVERHGLVLGRKDSWVMWQR